MVFKKAKGNPADGASFGIPEPPLIQLKGGQINKIANLSAHPHAMTRFAFK